MLDSLYVVHHVDPSKEATHGNSFVFLLFCIIVIFFLRDDWR
jgi:hypothetical protein